jgi:phage tail sheath protein FI
MAFNLLSPGVQFSEIDDSTVVVGTATTGGVLAGPFVWGPANLKTLLDSEITEAQIFSDPDDDTAGTWFTAAHFLQYGNNLNVVRVISADARNASVIDDGVTYVAPTVPGAGYNHVPTLTFSSGSAAATAVVANGEIVDVIITTSGSYPSGAPTITVTPTGGDIITVQAVLTPVVGLVITNETDYTQNFASNQQVNSGEFAARYPGALGNGIQCWICDSPIQFALWPYKGLFTGAPGTSDYVAAQGGSNDELHLVFVDTLGNITGTPGDVIESYGFVSKAVDAVDAQGNSIYYPNVLFRQSRYIYSLTWPTTTPSDNWGNKARNTVFDTLYVAATTASLTVEPGVTGIKYTAQAAGSAGNNITIQYVNTGSSGTLGVAVNTSAGTSAIVVTLQNGTSGTAGISTAQQVLSAINSYPAAAFLVSPSLTSSGTGAVYAYGPNPLTGGSNAIQYISILEGGVDGNSTVTDGQIMAGYDLFNTDDFSFNLILTADHDSTVVEYLITDIAEERQDCVVVFSPPEDAVVYNAGNETTDIISYANTIPSSTYAFMDGNYGNIYDKYNDLYRWIPLNGDTAGLCVYTDQVRFPWFSPAGLNRGNLRGIVSLAWNPKQAYRDVLYQASVNPIVSFAGQGPVLFGDKTFTNKPGAFDRINVRRLFIYIEQAISQAAKYTLFELNDDTTRAQFRGLIDPFLRDIEGNRGLYDYKIVCDATNNTAQMIDAHQFQGDIYLQPAKSINFIQLNFIATRTGIDFNEIVGQF